MSTFGCPHCEKTYPANASLIGRKVRCSGCKGVFQLQGDGTARKVDLPESQHAAGQQQKAATAKHVDVTRQLTRRTRRQVKKSLTERLDRGALREAAQQALAAAEAGDSQSDDAQKPSPASGSSLQRPAREIQVHLSKRQGLRPSVKIALYTAVAAVVLLLIVVVGFNETPPERRALDYYAGTVDLEKISYPTRMRVYRGRTWVYTRDGVDLPPVIVDADKAEITNADQIDWSQITATCREHVDGMSLMRQFAILVSSDKQAMIERLWDEYQQKHDIARFYKILRNEQIRFLHCRKLPVLLSQSGLSQRDVYIVSLLIAGTRDQNGSPCIDFGLISSRTAEAAHVYEFYGSRGLELVERTNEYAISRTGSYCGLIIGFSGVQGHPDEWRVLDVRFGKEMDMFYDLKYNPLITLSNRAMNLIMNAYANPDYEDEEVEEGLRQ